MAETTWSVKMDSDLKTKLSELIGDSDYATSKEFAENLIMLYEIDVAKKAAPTAMVDLDELQALTKQINRIFVNAGERFNNLSKSKDKECIETLQLKDRLIETLQDSISGLELQCEGFKNSNEELTDKYATLEKENNQQIDINKQNNLLIDEYKEKINTLSGLVNEYKGYKDEIDQVRSALADSQKFVSELNHQLSESDLKLNEAKDKIEFLEKQHKKEIDNLISQHQKEIEKLTAQNVTDISNLKTTCETENKQLKDKLKFEKEKALLDQSIKYEDRMKKINEENNDKVKELLEVNRSLVDELNKHKDTAESKNTENDEEDTKDN